MLWNLIRQAIYAACSVIGFVWTNYYLVQFTIATKGELTPANFLNFDLLYRLHLPYLPHLPCLPNLPPLT
jgi:hypothetical protein